MTGALFQLVGRGAQDTHLTYKPEITFFKSVYKKHTNFAKETVSHKFQSNTLFGNTAVINIPRNGDLITNLFIEVIVPELVSETTNLEFPVKLDDQNGTSYSPEQILANLNDNDVTDLVNQQITIQQFCRNGHFRWIQYLGHYLLKKVEIYIGNTLVDTQYAEWMQIWYELNRKPNLDYTYNQMIGNVPELYDPVSLWKFSDDLNSNFKPISSNSDVPHIYDSTRTPIPDFNSSSDNYGTIKSRTLRIPLQFWFSKIYGHALPLVALQYHDVTLKVEFEDFNNLVLGKRDTTKTYEMEDCSLLIDYIYLCPEERLLFTKSTHAYLIEQTQRQVAKFDTPQERVDLNFNHPCKYLAWTIQSNQKKGFQLKYIKNNLDEIIVNYNEQKNYTNFTTNLVDKYNGKNIMKHCTIYVNNQEFTSNKNGEFFNELEVWKYLKNNSSVGVYFFSFGIKPMDHMPSGTMNFSRQDSVILDMGLNSIDNVYPASYDYEAHIYTVNYNILNIDGGMGAVLYID